MLKSLIAAALGAALMVAPAAAETATINGLEMYYEVHGNEANPPLVLIHGAYMNIDANWGALIPTLSETHRVIAMELQAHGRTTDRDTPITYENMAQDVAALMDHLGIEKAAVFGYSMGATTGIRLAMDFPEKVERLVAASGAINYDAYPAEFYDMISGMTPQMFEGSGFIEEYQKYSPDPDGFPNLMAKLKALDMDRYAWDEAEFAKIDVPVLLIFGDADVTSMQHAARMYDLLGGNHDGDSKGLSTAQLAVLPGTPHTGVIFNPQNIEYLKMMVPVFLAQQLPQPPMMPGT